MNIDWIEGATHYGIGDDCPVFFRNIIKGESYEFKNVYSSGIMADWLECTGYIDIKNGLVERPKKQVVWDGVGLPPVGVICEHEPYEMRNEPHKVEIIAHKKTSLDVAVFWDKDQQLVSYSSYHSFRPIKTAEQLAEEERKSQILDMIDSFGTDTAIWGRDAVMEICGHLWEYGYRKQ